ncbi:DNA glycosylase AlkZ-like family protein [Kutzneria buriramensis]|uniref:Winged helix DNA-binding protein n=1 Tax=Kutzneria buriramensis TaxID=1045776 RepID=A0A3E0HUT5_9PSEU|nr:crosslink repair DNA glycosylase YcaQ family protein [Kutzneria buriramensis]REH50198.1 hypothetical protein BCF44_104473 [Kutzneria buriramensis]
MAVHKLSRTDARRIAVRAQLLGKARPTDLHDVVRGLTLLQVDATAAVAPSADLVAWSRLGSAYSPTELTEALAKRSLVDLRQMVRPAEDIALYRAEMDAWPGGDDAPGYRRYQHKWLHTNEMCRQSILNRLDAEGPLPARAFEDTCVEPWKSSGWTNNRNVVQMLEFMLLAGEVAVAGNDSGRLWDLAERVYPDQPAVPLAEALRTRNERRLQSLGIARAKGPGCPVEPIDVGEVGEPAIVEGVRGQWRVDPAQLGQRFAGRTALLSPLDRLVYDRKRMVEIFQFDYQLEMYKPAAKRRWGYYALPILHGDELVGKVDAAADRKAGVLTVNAVHEDEPFTTAITAAVWREIRDLAKWLELELAA